MVIFLAQIITKAISEASQEGCVIVLISHDSIKSEHLLKEIDYAFLNRGKIIPVIDVRVRFRQEPFEYNDRTCIIIINVNDILVGLIVETIAEVVEIDDSQIVPPPTLNPKNVRNQYVYGLGKVGDSVKMLLDPEKLIKDEELNFLEEVVNEAENEEQVDVQEREE